MDRAGEVIIIIDFTTMSHALVLLVCSTRYHTLINTTYVLYYYILLAVHDQPVLIHSKPSQAFDPIAHNRCIDFMTKCYLLRTIHYLYHAMPSRQLFSLSRYIRFTT